MSAQSLQQLMKAGTSPSDFAVAGQLTPDSAELLINTIIDQSGFLKMVTTKTSSKLSFPISGIDIAPRQLVYVSQGQEPTAEQKAQFSNVGKL